MVNVEERCGYRKRPNKKKRVRARVMAEEEKNSTNRAARQIGCGSRTWLRGLRAVAPDPVAGKILRRVA